MTKQAMTVLMISVMLSSAAEARSRRFHTMKAYYAWWQAHNHHPPRVEVPHIPAAWSPQEPMLLPCMTGTSLLDSYSGALSAYDRSPLKKCMTVVHIEERQTVGEAHDRLRR